MKKTIQFGEKEITFSSNASIIYIFKNQFGYDLLQKIMPVISETLRGIQTVFVEKQATETLNTDDKFLDLSGITLGNIADLFENIYSLEATDLMNIIWVMAKVNNKDIKEPEIFFAELEDFDILDCFKELAPMFLSSFISKKKMEKMMKKTQIVNQ